MTTEAQKVSKAQEKRTAETYRGSRNVMSGAGWNKKADVRTEDFLIENKAKLSKDAKSYTLKLADLRKLRKQAILDDRIPLFQIDMGGHRYVVLDEDDFLEMIDE